jgi:hypothetical protein
VYHKQRMVMDEKGESCHNLNEGDWLQMYRVNRNKRPSFTLTSSTHSIIKGSWKPNPPSLAHLLRG